MAKKPMKRGLGLRSVAASVERVTGSLHNRQGFAEPALIQGWGEIVGPELAAQSSPIRLVPAKDGNGGTLHVRVSGPLALELQHLQPQVLQRVNGYFGYRAVSRLALRQAPTGTPRRQPPPGRKPVALTANQQAELDAQLSTVTDPELRDALSRLGRQVMSHNGRAGDV